MLWAVAVHVALCVIGAGTAATIGIASEDVNRSAAEYVSAVVLASAAGGIFYFVLTGWFMVPGIAAVIASVRHSRRVRKGGHLR